MTVVFRVQDSEGRGPPAVLRRDPSEVAMVMICVIDGCTKAVPPPFCLCNDCWKLLPAPIRVELSRSFNPHREIDEQSPGFHNARAKAHSWIRETLGGADDRPRKSWAQLVEWIRARDAARGHRTPEPRSFDTTETDEPQPAPPAQMRLL